MPHLRRRRMPGGTAPRLAHRPRAHVVRARGEGRARCMPSRRLIRRSHRDAALRPSPGGTLQRRWSPRPAGWTEIVASSRSCSAVFALPSCVTGAVSSPSSALLRERRREGFRGICGVVGRGACPGHPSARNRVQAAPFGNLGGLEHEPASEEDRFLRPAGCRRGPQRRRSLAARASSARSATAPSRSTCNTRRQDRGGRSRTPGTLAGILRRARRGRARASRFPSAPR